MMKIEVLYEDNHCLAVNKPAGLLSQGDETGDPSLVSWARDVPEGPVREARQRVSSAWSTDLTAPPRGWCCWPGPARRRAACRTSSAPARSPRCTGPSSRASRIRPRAGGLTFWRRTGAEPGSRARRAADRGAGGPGGRIGWWDAGGVTARWNCVRRRVEAISSGSSSLTAGCRSWGTVKYGAATVLEAEDGHRRIALHCA